MSAAKNKTTPPARPPPARALSSGGAIYAAGALLVLAGLIAYWNSFSAPFVFDDDSSILNNPTIRHLGLETWSPPTNGETVSGRPLLNFSFALDFALRRLNPKIYHVTNLAIHLAAGLLLFGLVRRTLLRPVLRERFGAAATALGFAIALVWTLHPLQTESVTYIVQRAESLMGMFYLLTLYCFVRGVEFVAPGRWQALSVFACLFGMLTKEVMVTAPLLVLLYDRTFVAGTFAASWKQRGRLYGALACTWLPLAWLVASVSLPANAVAMNLNKNTSDLAGLGPGMKSFDYALKQCEAVVHYLQLSFWPHPLVLDYGWDVVTRPLAVAPQMALLAMLLAGTLYALWKKPAAGFLGASFFVILAPTSSIVPLAGQTMAEHHMYLSLAAVVAGAVLITYQWAGPLALAVWVALALVLGGVTIARNQVYQSALTLWADTAQKRPDNARAHCELGNEYYRMGRLDEALHEYNLVAKLDPGYPDAQDDIGLVLLRQGHLEDALAALALAVQQNPDFAVAHFDYGNALVTAKRLDEAEAQYTEALKLHPNYAAAHHNLGSTLALEGKLAQAVQEYQEALRIQPDYPDAKNNLARVQSQINSQGRGN